MLDWKIIASVLIGLILFLAGLIHASGLGDFFNEVKDYVGKVTGGFISNIFSRGERKTIPIHAEFSMNDYTLSSRVNVEEIFLEYNVTAIVTLSDKVVDTTGLESVDMNMKEFEGEVSLNSSSISFNGKISHLSVNGVRISSEGSYHMETGGIRANRVLLRGIEGVEINGDEFDGEISVGSATFIISQDPIEMQGFSGDIEIENGRMVLDGRAVKLLVKGDVYSAIVSE